MASDTTVEIGEDGKTGQRYIPLPASVCTDWPPGTKVTLWPIMPGSLNVCALPPDPTPREIAERLRRATPSERLRMVERNERVLDMLVEAVLKG